MSEKLADVRYDQLYRELGFSSWEAFVRLHLAEHPRFVERAMLVGLAALDAFGSDGETVNFRLVPRLYAPVEDDWERLPVGLLRGLARLTTEKGYWKTIVGKMLWLVASGTASARQVKLALKRSTARAHRQETLHRARRRPRRVRWWVRTKDGAIMNQDLETAP